MRISGLDKSSGESKSGRATSSKSRSVLKSIFLKNLGVEESRLTDAPLEFEKLKSAFEDAGDQLDKEPTLSNFKQFRDLLGAITRHVLKRGLRLDKIGGTALDPRYHEIVTIVDREADALYRMLVTKHSDHISLTKKIMEIRGLVIDLLS